MYNTRDFFNTKRANKYAYKYQKVNDKTEKWIGKKLFESIKQDELDITYPLSASDRVVEGSIVSFNSEAKIINNKPLSVASVESHKIASKKMYEEKELLQFINFLQNSNNTFLDNNLFNKTRFIFKSVEELTLSVEAVVESMRIQLISHGKIERKESLANDSSIQVNLDYKRNQKNTVKLTGDKAWTNTELNSEGEYKSNPIKDIINMTNHLTSTSERPSFILCTTEAFSIFCEHPAVKRNIWGDVNSRGLILSVETVNNYLRLLNLPQIIIYDESRDVQTKTKAGEGYESKKFLDTDLFVFIPAGFLGETIFTKTLEEIAYLSENEDVQEYEDGFIFVKSWITDESIQAIIKACAITVISCPRVDSTACIKIR